MEGKTKKQNLELVLFPLLALFILAGLILPLYPAQAFLQELGQQIAMQTIGRIFQLLLLIGNFLVQVTIWLLDWMVSGIFSGSKYASYTSTANPVINIGWTLTRDLANMFLILVMVVIGLATALRLGEYQWQRTLPRLIVVALLINFTPVLLGLAVDASNIIMNFFLGNLSGTMGMGNAFQAQTTIIEQTFQRGFGIENIPTAAFQTLILLFFDFLAAFIFFLFAILLFLRHIAIWMLVILSPVAFLAWILPATRDFFRTWLNQFIQWCIIGIFAAFFLYLGNHIIVQTPKLGLPAVVPAEQPNVGNIITDLMPFVVALTFLGIGFFVALSTPEPQE
jgi:hypothetical protein